MDEVEKLIEQLKDKDVYARRNAAVRLGKIKDKRAVPALIEALKDKDGGVLREATLSLEKIRKPAVLALIEKLKDEDARMRVGAAEALGRIGDASAVPDLIETLGDEDWNVRENAVFALGSIGDASAVPALIEALKHKESFVRSPLVWALEEIVEKCETTEDFDKVEKGIDKGSVALRKEKDRDVRISAQIELAKLTRKIAERKNELAPKKDLLLDDKPKPPKKGNGVYRALRKCRC